MQPRSERSDVSATNVFFSGLSEKFWSQLFLRCIFSLRLRKFVCIRARRVLEFGEALRSN